MGEVGGEVDGEGAVKGDPPPTPRDQMASWTCQKLREYLQAHDIYASNMSKTSKTNLW